MKVVAMSPFELARLPVAVTLLPSTYEGSAQDDRGLWWDVGRSGKLRVRVFSGKFGGQSRDLARWRGDQNFRDLKPSPRKAEACPLEAVGNVQSTNAGQLADGLWGPL